MLAIIGGSGFYALADDFKLEQTAASETPYGSSSAEILIGRWQNNDLLFLPRHGPGHRVPPHKINYRANIWALKELGAGKIISINAVGGITESFGPQTVVLPDQIIDYSSGRDTTFFDGADGNVQHIDFSRPYSEELRQQIMQASVMADTRLENSATYACTNGPRLETAAEIQRLRRDGCDLVGMTGMPEAALARELQIEYASLSLVVNWAAGVSGREITMNEIMNNLSEGMGQIMKILACFVKQVSP
ncbi:MAG: S-methyl-5'-thioinosine phosphorylase [Pseudomonadota bacterium]